MPLRCSGVILKRLVCRKRSRLVSLRLDESVINKYDKLVALLRALDSDIRVSRSVLMRAVLERAVERLLREPRLALIILKSDVQ